MRLLGCLGIVLFLSLEVGWSQIPTSPRSESAITRQEPNLRQQLDEMGLNLGSEVFLRIFKEERELEVWILSGERFNHFRTYPICTFSGDLGPKQKQGDRQSPEGFYFVTGNRLNPWSTFHLSINLGYPNAYDRAHGYTGDYLMIHGDCVSIGCYAMTDEGIEQIYTLVFKALEHGQPFVRVHVFPFRMTERNLIRFEDSEWLPFWRNLKTGYEWFEQRGIPPNVEVRDRKYVFD